MRTLIAIIAGIAIFAFGFGSMRGLARPRGTSTEPPPLDPQMRVLYWCENCNAEILVVRQGNGHTFRHCGEGMIRREEVARELS